MEGVAAEEEEVLCCPVSSCIWRSTTHAAVTPYLYAKSGEQTNCIIDVGRFCLQLMP